MAGHIYYYPVYSSRAQCLRQKQQKAIDKQKVCFLWEESFDGNVILVFLQMYIFALGMTVYAAADFNLPKDQVRASLLCCHF